MQTETFECCGVPKDTLVVEPRVFQPGVYIMLDNGGRRNGIMLSPAAATHLAEAILKMERKSHG